MKFCMEAVCNTKKWRQPWGSLGPQNYFQIASTSFWTQTENGLELKCTECNFEATNNFELSWYLEKSHGWSNDKTCDDQDSSEGVRCDYQAADTYDMDGHLWSEHK